MSRDNSEKKKLSREERKKVAVRVVAMIMAVLMILGLGVTAISILLGSRARAAEPVSVIDTSSLKQSGDVLINVGIRYGTSVTPAYACTSEEGFLIGSQETTGEREFRELWSLDNESVLCAADVNLAREGDGYEIADSERGTDLGAYRLEVDCLDCDRDDLEDLIWDNRRMAARMGYDLIPAYVRGSYAIRIGSFRSYDDAYDELRTIRDLFPDRRISVVSPTDTGVQILDPDWGTTLFAFDCDGEEELGLSAREDRSGNTYIHTASEYYYDGVFAFKRAVGRAVGGSSDGLTVLNIIPLEAYIAGVLPYETSNSWPTETMKAFAVAVRSFTLNNCGDHGKHRNLGFDLCTEVCCQVYRGAGRTNDAVMDAVLGTEGLVMTYNRDIVTGFYSSSVGGVTVNAEDAWPGTDPVPFLKAVPTPWENYMEHENAFWINEVSPTALLDRLRQAGYTQLRGAVESMEIVRLAQNSTYIKTLRVTDTRGNQVEIDTTDAVRSSLTPYVKSANFVVGKGKVEYTEDIVIGAEQQSPAAPEAEPEPEVTGPLGMEYSFTDLDEYVVITSDSLEKSYFSNSVLLTAGDGMVDYFRKDIFAITAENTAAFLGDEYDEMYRNDDYVRVRTELREPERETETVSEDEASGTVYKIAYAEDSDNFIFVGKGWGHGVGMSQWGAFDLAVRGYTAREILDAYYTDVEIMDYRDTNQY